MATLNLGRLKPVFRGSWNNATAYNVDDIVVRNNQSYISIQAGTNHDPATATAYWTLMAAAGTDVGATLANKEIAFKTNAGALDGIPIGNAGEFLKVNSGATGYEYGSVSSDFVKLAEVNSSTQTGSIVIDDLDVSTYSAFRIYWNSVPGNDDAYLYFRMRTGGSSGTDHTTAYYDSAEWGVTGSGGSNYSAHENNQQEWRPLNNGGSEDWEGHRMILDFYPRKSGYAGRMGNFYTALGMRLDSSNNFRAIYTTGVYNHSDLPNPTGLKFFPNTGDFKHYNYKVYGVK